MKKMYTLLCALAICIASMVPAKANAVETCTLSGVFWMQHLDVWPAPFTPDSEICDLTFTEVMQTPSDGTPWYILAHEWIPAQLNIANGAVSECVLEAFEEAEALLSNCDFSQFPEDVYQYLALTGALADYNNGVLTGCPGCPEGTIVICPPCVCPACPECPGCCCPPCPEVPACPDIPPCPPIPACPECPECPEAPKCPDCECGDCACFAAEPNECKCGDCVCPESPACGDCNCPDQVDCVCNCPACADCPVAPACNCPAIPPCNCDCSPYVECEPSSSCSSSSSHHKHKHHRGVKNAKAQVKKHERAKKRAQAKKQSVKKVP